MSGIKIAVFVAASIVMSQTAVGAVVRPAPIDLPSSRAFPESITASADGTLYVGSVAEGGIVRIRPGGKPEVWIKPGADGTRSIFGVKADSLANRLWVCTNDMSSIGVPGPGSVRGSWLKAFDLTTSRLVVSARLPGDRTLCNDIALGADGSAYVTNSWAPQILRLRPDSASLEIWANDPRFASPPGGAGLDGIAFSGDGTLYVDTFTKAQLFRIAIKVDAVQSIEELRLSRPLVLADALKPFGEHDLVLVEGGGRLDSISIQGTGATVETLKSGLDGPTGVALDRGTAWVAEGQLSHLIGPNAAAPPQLPFQLYPVTLSIR